MGAKTNDAFFGRCDATTMAQGEIKLELINLADRGGRS